MVILSEFADYNGLGKSTKYRPDFDDITLGMGQISLVTSVNNSIKRKLCMSLLLFLSGIQAKRLNFHHQKGKKQILCLSLFLNPRITKIRRYTKITMAQYVSSARGQNSDKFQNSTKNQIFAGFQSDFHQ